MPFEISWIISPWAHGGLAFYHWRWVVLFVRWGSSFTTLAAIFDVFGHVLNCLVVKSLTGYPSCAVTKTSGRNVVGITFMFPRRIAASLVLKLFKASFIICFFSSGCNDPFLMSSSITFKTKILNYSSIPLKLCTRLILEYWHCSCICYFRYAVYCYLSSSHLQFGVLLILCCCIGRGCLEPYLGDVVVHPT